MFSLTVSPWLALGVVVATACTDAVYVFFSAAVLQRQAVAAASWSSLWYILAAFAVINYTRNPAYVAFAMLGSWLGAYASVMWLKRPSSASKMRGT